MRMESAERDEEEHKDLEDCKATSNHDNRGADGYGLSPLQQ